MMERFIIKATVEIGFDPYKLMAFLPKMCAHFYHYYLISNLGGS